jgi:hypothetical protein
VLNLVFRKEKVNLLKRFSRSLLSEFQSVARFNMWVGIHNVYLTSGHIKYTKKMAAKQDKAIQIHIFHPMFCKAIPPANTVMKEKSHSPKAPAAAPA